MYKHVIQIHRVHHFMKRYASARRGRIFLQRQFLVCD